MLLRRRASGSVPGAASPAGVHTAAPSVPPARPRDQRLAARRGAKGEEILVGPGELGLLLPPAPDCADLRCRCAERKSDLMISDLPSVVTGLARDNQRYFVLMQSDGLTPVGLAEEASRQETFPALPRVVLFGHSHMGALVAAFDEQVSQRRQSLDLFSYQFLRTDRPHIVNVGGRWRYNPECEDELRRLIAQTRPFALISMLQGEQAVAAGLIMPERRFDFYFPGEETYVADPAQEIVPYDLLLEACKIEHHLVSDLLDRLKPFVTVPIFALCPPPPIDDEEFILASNPKHANIAEHLAKRGLPATHWRYRIWKVHIAALRAIYEARGIRFIEPPREAIGANGCLDARFRSDVFHANAAYGHLLLQQTQQLITPDL